MKKKIETDEIDLLEVLINIWNNKLKIIAITISFVFISTLLYIVNKPGFIARTEILPVSIFNSDLYSSYNLLLKTNINNNYQQIQNNNYQQIQNNKEETLLQFGFKEIDKKYLLDLFIEELLTKNVIIQAIKKYQIIDQNKFTNQKEYLEAVEKKAATFKLLEPFNIDGAKRGETRSNWIIESEIKDKEKWEDALIFIENEINKIIKNFLKENFDTNLNNFVLINKFKLEDLEQKIKNVKVDYNTETNNRITFLKEQASIARELNIENNTLEVENFNTPSGIISNLQTETPYYMRGYAMIEKEIELIENRTEQDKNTFTNSLFELEKQKRDLLENKLYIRLQNIFDLTPINKKNFQAANIIYYNTEFKNSFSLIKIIFLSGLFGVIFGMFYVLISNAIQQRK